VLAVPGAVWSAQAEGVNALLRAGATPVTSVEDVLDALGLAPRPPEEPSQAERGGLAGLAWRALRLEPCGAEALALRLGAGAAELGAALCELQLAGAIVEERDGRLVAIDGP
jgi:DNA processing protein